MDISNLHVTIYAARGIGKRTAIPASTDHTELAAPVLAKCFLQIVDKAGKKRENRTTHAAKKSNSPTWDSHLVFSVDSDAMGIDASLIDAETEDVLGHVALPLPLSQPGKLSDDWYMISSAKKSTSPGSSSTTAAATSSATENRLGQLHIRLEFISTDEKQKIEAEEKQREDSRRREREIFRLFSIEDEPFIKEFSCAFEKKILHQGRLYVTPHYVMFNAPFAKKTIPLDDIKSIERRKTAGVFNTAVAIITKDEKENVFKSFRKRGECIDCLTKQLQILGKNISDSFGDSLDDMSESTLPGGEEAVQVSPISKPSRSSSSLTITSPSKPSHNKSKRLSAPANKKVRRSSDDPLEPQSHLSSASLPREPSLAMSANITIEESSSDENLVVVEKKEMENSARLKQKLLIGDLVSGEEESSDEVPPESSKNSSSSAYRSAHDASSPISTHSSPPVDTRLGDTNSDIGKPHPFSRSVSGPVSPRKDKKERIESDAVTSPKKRKSDRPKPNLEPSSPRSPSIVTTPTSPTLSGSLETISWPQTTKDLVTVGLRLGTAIFVVAFVASLVFPGIQWGSVSSWLLSSLYIAVLSSVMRLLLSKHAASVADSLILAIGGKVSSRTAVIGDSVLPALCMLLIQATLLYSSSWLFSDFYITSWRSLILHSAVSALSSTFVLSVTIGGARSL